MRRIDHSSASFGARIRAYFGACSVPQIILWAILALLPFITLFLLSLASGHNCFEALPLWSDELDYWREVYSFSALEPFGYYSFVGHDPAVGTAGCHGLAPFYVYGLPSIIFGWHYSSIVIWNTIYCSIAFILFALILRPQPKMVAYVSLLWLIYPGIHRFLPTSMMEIPHYALIIVYAALLIRAVERKRLTKLSLTMLVLLVLMMIALRINELVFFFPVLALVLFFQGKRNFVLCAVVFMLLTVVSYVFQGLFTAGYPYSVLSEVSAQDTLTEKFLILKSNAIWNIRNFFSFDEGLLQTSQRYAYFIVMLSLIALFIVLMRMAKNAGNDGLFMNRLLRYLCVASVCILFASFCFIAIFYDIFDWRDYRTLSPILWSQLLLFALLASMRGDESWKGLQSVVSKCGIWSVIIVCLLFACALRSFSTQAAFEEPRYADASELSGFSQEQTNLSIVEPLGDDADMRTAVSLSGGMPYSYWFALQPEIGISSTYEEDEALSSEAAYLIAAHPLDNPGPYKLLLDNEGCCVYRLAA